MYNLQQHTRLLQFSDQCKKIQDEHVKLSELRKYNNVKMSANHARRIDAFMLSTLEKPIPVTEYKSPPYEPRKLSANKHDVIKHPLPFRMNYHTDAERIDDVNAKTRDLDAVPFHNPTHHRFRDLASSSLTKPIRLNASCSAFRVYENVVKINRSNEVAIYENPKLEKIFRSTCPITSQSRNLKAFQRGIAPTLHRKTYFNSVRTLTNTQLERGSYGRKREMDDKNDQKENKKANKENLQESSNRRQNALEALTKCGLWTHK